MKLRQYTKQQGMSYQTALRWFRHGTIQDSQAPSGTISVTEREPVQAVENVVIYARVSSSEHRENVERQAERVSQYCTVRGDHVALVVKEIASGVNDSRPKLLSLLKDTSITWVGVEHRDGLTRFGFQYSHTLFSVQGRVTDVVKPAENEKEELLADLAGIISSFCARLYGQRRAKRKTEKVVQELEAKETSDPIPDHDSGSCECSVGHWNKEEA